MAGDVAQLTERLRKDTLAEQIYSLWNKYFYDRRPWIKEQEELRDYVFATDTTKTSNRTLPWRNTTTSSKITQIFDNLHANYIAALFSNDDWLKWEGFTLDDATREKREAIEFYMKNKIRNSGFYTTISQAISDYILNGNAFGDAEWVHEEKEDPITGEKIPGYVGPRAVRYSPYDIIINPIASSFRNSPKMVRKIMNIGELKILIDDSPETDWIKEAVSEAIGLRSEVARGIYSHEDFSKANAYTIDGFGNLYEYFQSPYVELIEFEGDLYDYRSDVLYKNYVITVMDRNRIVRMKQNPSWLPKGTKVHAGWRPRPDNLYAMGPLHNLVGMQYRIDHLENIKADVFDLIAFPPLKIKGNVEDFDWGPCEEIHMDPEDDVEMLVPDTTALQADLQIQVLEQRMEEYAGAPKQAMGIRTPGEKTAYEVQALESAAGRIFKEKVENFEINFLEPLLNSMLELAVRNMDSADTIRVFDDEMSEVMFKTITKEDITANGKLRPIGARHFFAQQQLVQNLTGLMASPVAQKIDPHVSGIALARLLEDVFGWERYQVIQENVAIMEQFNQQKMVNILQEQLVSEDATQNAIDSNME